MKMKNLHVQSGNVIVIFWLGLLTGALAVGLIFLYRAVSQGEFDAALLRAPRYNTSTTSTSSAKSLKGSAAAPIPPIGS